MAKLRPFLPNLSVGTDITHVPRIAKLVQNRMGFAKFLRKLLTPREQHEFYARFGKSLQEASSLDGRHWRSQADKTLENVSTHLAGRWAAKEAMIKAFSQRKLVHSEVQVRRHKKGASVFGVILDRPAHPGRLPQGPELHLQPHAEIDEDETGQIVQVSISHEAEFATAVCLATVAPAENEVEMSAEDKAEMDALIEKKAKQAEDGPAEYADLIKKKQQIKQQEVETRW